MGFLTGVSPAVADHLTEAQRYPNTDPIEVWSATLTVARTAGGTDGCNTDGGSKCSNPSILTDDDITSYGYSLTVRAIVEGNQLNFRLYQSVPDSLYLHATLHVGDTQLAFYDATRDTVWSTNDTLTWSNHGLTSSVGDVVELRITRPAWWFGTELFGGDLVTEAGFAPTLNIASDSGSGTFQVRLTQAPTANVTVNRRRSPISCAGCADVPPSDIDSASVSPAVLTFTSSNFSTGQTVTVSGVADDDSDDEHFVLLAIVSAASTASENDRYRAPLSVAGVHVKVQEGGSQQGKSFVPLDTITETDIIVPKQTEPQKTSPQQASPRQAIPAPEPHTPSTLTTTTNTPTTSTPSTGASTVAASDVGDRDAASVLPAGIGEYDTNNNGKIDLSEMLRAAQDYQNNKISRQQLLAIIRHYLNN
ncbi:MAG: hypothetical protein KTV16_01275 [Acidimicrobiia bacterium]|nr:hypothetical protein [Acidimicrobiia bacterium]